MTFLWDTELRELAAMALYPDREELKRQYPELQDDDIQQALALAAAALDDQVIDLPTAI